MQVGDVLSDNLFFFRGAKVLNPEQISDGSTLFLRFLKRFQSENSETSPRFRTDFGADLKDRKNLKLFISPKIRN